MKCTSPIDLWKSMLLLCLLATGSAAHGQRGKQIEVPLVRNQQNGEDTSGWYRQTMWLASCLKLEDLRASNDRFHLRLWTHNQAIDIWTGDEQTYFARVSSFARRYDKLLYRKGVYKIDKVYSRKKMLDPALAKALHERSLALGIPAMPDQHKIKGWQDGLDGEAFFVEMATPATYAFRAYWTPYVFAATIPGARNLQAFIETLLLDYKLREELDRLRLPPGHYEHNGIPGIRINTEPPTPKVRIWDWF